VFIMLGAMNYELDVVALSGFIIILGILVDDAIIVAENIYHRFEMGDDPIDAAVNGLSEVFKPVMTTIFTTFLAFAPMFFIPGIMGRFVFVIPLVITMALIASTFELIIALPAHLVPALERRQKKARQNPNAPTRNWFDPLRKLCRIVVKFSLRFRYVVLVLCVALASGWFWYAHHFMEVILFPNSAADEFHVMMELPMGSSLEASSEKVKELEKVVATIPDDEISAYVTRAGRWGVDFAVDGERYATVQVILTPFAQRTRTVNDIIADLRAETDKIEGITKLVFHIKSGGPPIGPPVMIRVVSPHDAMRNLLTQDLVTFLNGLPGVHDVDNDVRPGKKQVQIQLNYNRLAELGLTAADVAQNVRIAYDGQLVTSARYGDEDVDFRVILQDEARRDTQYLEKLLIPNQQGRLIPLQRIANLEISEGIAAYHHYRFKRSTTIKANVDTAETTPIDVLNAVREHFNVTQDYPGARLVMEGEAVETEQSMSDLLITMLTAVIGIYFLLIILFDSAVQPILVMITIPFGAAAVIHTFAMHDEPIGFLALLGLVGLSGVVVNDSLVLVSHINEMRKKHRGDRLLNIIAAGTADRLRAIVMTTITTVVGLIPLAYGWGGSDPFMAPMALAMGYGLLLVTPLTLVLVPCLYTVALDIQFFGEWIKGKVFGNPEETETS
jgi:multidrug efflux pump subunit AcrB